MADYERFYRKLYAPLRRRYGVVSPDTIVPLIGFDAGGPLSFCVFPPVSRAPTYVSCELAVRRQQKPSEFGRFELLATSTNEKWVRSTLSEIGRASFDFRFGHRHTLDIGPWVSSRDSIQGILFEKVVATRIDSKPYAVLRCVGLARVELEYALAFGVGKLIAALKGADLYPVTVTRRRPVV